MTKEQSLTIKGVAILLMIYVHLFTPLANCLNFANYIFVGDFPLTYALTACMDPVPFFYFLGGYGLYCVNLNIDKHYGIRIFRLYLHFWIIVTLFTLIGHFVYPDQYPGSTIEFLKNLSSIWYTYNGTYWFLLPYATLSLAFPMFYWFLQRYNGIFLLFVVIFLGLPVSFFAGALFKRYEVFERTDTFFSRRKYLPLLLLIVVSVAQCFLREHSNSTIYAITFIVLFHSIPLSSWVRKVLILCGRHSMNMWFIHYWFILLFAHYLYALRLPVVAFVVVTLLSMGTSIAINYVARPLFRFRPQIGFLKG